MIDSGIIATRRGNFRVPGVKLYYIKERRKKKSKKNRNIYIYSSGSWININNMGELNV